MKPPIGLQIQKAGDRKTKNIFAVMPFRFAT